MSLLFRARACSSERVMYHPRFHRDDNSLETLESVTFENATPKNDPTGGPKSTTRSRGHFPAFTCTPLVSRHALHGVSMPVGSGPRSSTKRKSSVTMPHRKKRRKTVAPCTTLGKEPGCSQVATAASIYVDNDFSVLPQQLHELEDVALEGIDLDAPLPILSQNSKSSLKSSGEEQGNAHGSSFVDCSHTRKHQPKTKNEYATEASSKCKTPKPESWKQRIDQLMWEPILTGDSSAFTPVTLPGSPRELIAVFTPPPKRVLFDTNGKPSPSPAKSASPRSRPAPLTKDRSCADNLDLLDAMSVTEVVAV
jgi:hypothetical protein